MNQIVCTHNPAPKKKTCNNCIRLYRNLKSLEYYYAKKRNTNSQRS